LFINETDIGYGPYVNSWLERSKLKTLRELGKDTYGMPE
jgi:hypothetical protein